MAKSDLTLGLSLSDENIQVMKRFCDSVDFLKQASQSGADVKLHWPENPTAAQSAPASAAQTAPIVPRTPAPSPALATAAPIAPAPVPAPVAPVPGVNPTPAVSASAPSPVYMPGVQPQTAVPTAPVANFTPAIPSMAPVTPTAAPAYTLEQISKAGADLAAAGKTPQLLGLLQQFGIQAVNMLPKEQYGAFATALRGLGAQL
ncbi:hypothetical protein OBV_01880 [Oscillibacter valericigenes Sjm18-20]|nr:hypothetical protein OBV_01880 [Oscillibacter valericigenes Sjm18-20]